MTHGYCLKGPKRKLIPVTFAATKDGCWTEAFMYLYDSFPWMSLYWKKWDESIKAAEEHGYKMVKVKLVEETTCCSKT